MPTIIGLEEQQKALKWIRNSLKDLAVINEFLSAANTSGEYTITFTADDDKKHTVTIIAASKEEVHPLILKSKGIIKSEVLKTAEDYHIGLDEKDKEILGI